MRKNRIKRGLLIAVILAFIGTAFTACGKKESEDIQKPGELKYVPTYASPKDDVTIKDVYISDKDVTCQLFYTDDFNNSGVKMTGIKTSDWSSNEWTYGINDKNVIITQAYSAATGLYSYSLMYNNRNYCMVAPLELTMQDVGMTFTEILLAQNDL